METVVRLAPGEGLRVFGPARVRVEQGEATILGVPLSEGREIEIPAGRSYYLLALERAVVSLALGEGARVEAPRPGEEPLQEWIREVDSLLEQCSLPCTVVALGPVDAGKTSAAALTANRAFAAGLRPYIVDADIGQADIGPPGFVTGSLPEEPVVWLRQLQPDRMVFVGHVEPGPVMAQVTMGVLRLRDRAKEASANTLVVDTDGWVEGWHALESKLYLLRALEADAVLVLGDERLYRFLRHRWPGRVSMLRSPSVQARRDRSERIELRRLNYRRFLEGAPVRELSVRTTPLLNACLPLGAREQDEGWPRVYEYPGGICAVYNTSDMPGPGEIKNLISRYGVREALVLYTGGFRGVLVGLSDMEGWDHPGVIESVDIEQGIVRVRSRYLGPVRMMIAGRIRLSDDYTDTGARRIWV